jgi:uncharacterized membrane protein (UPF0136 family)
VGGYLIKSNIENPLQTGPTGYLMSLIASVILVAVGAIRFNATKKFMPAGLLLILGLIGSIVFYMEYKKK